MTISASQVKALRERSGAGMMECKRALAEAGGDEEAALEILRKKGAAKAEKKAGRIAAEGVIGLYQSDDGRLAAMVEVNCETDFVAKEPAFREFAAAVAERVARQRPSDPAALADTDLDGDTVEARRRALVAKIGENITVRRFTVVEAPAGARLASYLHGTRIGVLVVVEGGGPELGRDLAMHIAASRPQYIAPADVPAEVQEKEKAIFLAQAQDSGKPPEIAEKMVGGRLRKFLNEISLLGQPFVKDPDQTVGQLLKREQARVHAFERFEVGEGIEKRQEDFAAEVMAQVQGD